MTGKDLFAALSFVDDCADPRGGGGKACATRVSCAGRALGRGARRLRLPARRLGVCGGAPAVRGQHVERNGRCGGRAPCGRRAACLKRPKTAPMRASAGKSSTAIWAKTRWRRVMPRRRTALGRSNSRYKTCWTALPARTCASSWRSICLPRRHASTRGRRVRAGGRSGWLRPATTCAFCRRRALRGETMRVCGLFTAEQLEQFDAADAYGYDFYFPKNADGTPLDWNEPTGSRPAENGREETV